jgi:glucose-6-phosphate 1-dehydrogenase
VPEGSRAPTYAACRLQINNERWAGVPFVLRAGKALNERSVVVRIQLHENPVPLFGPHGAHQQMRNEFVMRLQPGEEPSSSAGVLLCYRCTASLLKPGCAGWKAFGLLLVR